jgi:4-hydroxy-3-methylbut-2-en-1-yl diphosphate synthase IspG/GcpE
MAKVEILRPGVLSLNSNEIPSCPECGGKDFDFERSFSSKLKFPSDSVVLDCHICGCIWRLSASSKQDE